MLLGKVFDEQNKQSHQKYLVNYLEICWRFLFQHRDAAVVIISDEAGDTKIEMQNGKLVWPMDDELQRDIQTRFAALKEAQLIPNAS